MDQAVATRTSIRKAIADLLRSGRAFPESPKGADQPPSLRLHPQTGFPLIELRAGTTLLDIQRAEDDDDLRHLEMLEASPEANQRDIAE